MNEMSPDLTTPRPVRFTVDDFLRMDDAGVFDRHAKTELIDGAVLSMNAQHRRHSRVKNELVERIRIALRRADPALSALSEVSVVLPPDNLPEPDIVILFDDGGDGPVTGSSVRLIVEVADTTLGLDIGEKRQLYADAVVPEYWVVDVVGRRIARHHRPQDGSYVEQGVSPFGAPITAATIPGLTIATTGL